MSQPDLSAPPSASPPPAADGRANGDRRLRPYRGSRAFRAVKAEHAADMTRVERFATRLTLFASSAPFLVFHVVWFGVWIPWNIVAGPAAFDPFPFGLLTMIVSLEAIFLSIFVLMTQNRESSIAEVREEVSLAVTLRVEEEVTKVLQLVSGLYGRLGQQVADDPELKQMLQPLDAEAIERDLTAQIEAAMEGRRAKRGRRGPRRHG
jgi:uncharacterized membrane protein